MPAMDTHYLRVWREQAREHGIPEPDIDQWLGLARPAQTGRAADVGRVLGHPAAVAAAACRSQVGQSAGRVIIPVRASMSSRFSSSEVRSCPPSARARALTSPRRS